MAALAALCLCLAPDAAPAQTVSTYDPVKLDPVDLGAVQHVCTACHTTERIFHVHSWTDWVAVFDTMSGYGAKGTDDDWDRIANFLQLTLTTININTASADEIAPVLKVGDDVAAAIVARREKQKFTSLAELEAMPGTDRQRLETLKPRISF